jgi:hypothetical protein
LLYNPKTKSVQSVQIEPRKVAGRDLAHRKRTAVERALLAADIAAGRVVVVELTLRQANSLTGASPTYASAAVKLDAGERRSVANGWRSLIPQITRRALPTLSLGDLWDRATPAEREAAVRPRIAQVWGAIEKVIA